MGTHPMAAALAKGSHAATEAIPNHNLNLSHHLTPQASKENEPGDDFS